MLTTKNALEAYARMINTLNSSEFEQLISDEFCYESQAVIAPLKSKSEFIDYIRPKLVGIKSSKIKVYAEMGQIDAYGQKECVLIAEESKDNLIATVYAQVENHKITRINLCLVPDPTLVNRTNIYPH